MPTTAENIANFQQNIMRRVGAIGAELAVVQNTDRHVEYKQGLYEELLAIQQLMASGLMNLQNLADAGEPFEIETTGMP